jgi:hypothetical protein
VLPHGIIASTLPAPVDALILNAASRLLDRRTMTEALQASADELMAMMHADGPVVKCVIVAADGTAAEVELDMTPKKEAVKEALGGAVTFLGQWEPLGVFLLVRREDGGLPKFAGTLPKPFDAATGVFGGARELPDFGGSSLGRFPLVSADFGTSDHPSERSRRADAFPGTRARGTPTLKRRCITRVPPRSSAARAS